MEEVAEIVGGGMAAVALGTDKRVSIYKCKRSMFLKEFPSLFGDYLLLLHPVCKQVLRSATFMTTLD